MLELSELCLKIIAKKMKVVIITNQPNVNIHTTLHNAIVEQVQKLKYIGNLLTNDADCSQEVKIYIEQARQAFLKLKKLYHSS